MISYNSDLQFWFTFSGTLVSVLNYVTSHCFVSFSATSLKHVKLMEVQFYAVGTVAETLNHLTEESLSKGTRVAWKECLVPQFVWSLQNGFIRIPVDNLLIAVNNFNLFLFLLLKVYVALIFGESLKIFIKQFGFALL